MFFDAVVDRTTNEPIFNDTPDKVKEFLKGRTETENSNVDVFEGAPCRWISVPEYLDRLC